MTCAQPTQFAIKLYYKDNSIKFQLLITLDCTSVKSITVVHK